MIQTINGLISAEQIHFGLYHEHFAFGKMDYINEDAPSYNREVAYQKYKQMVPLMMENKVNLVIDATPIEWGRDPLLLSKLSEETGLAIVCATGFFKDEGDALQLLKSISYICTLEEYLTNLFVTEIRNGIGDTGCRAGVIKVASSLNEIKPLEETLFLAAARAHKITNTPIITHCDRGTMGLAQAKLLIEHGVNPESIVIGHMTSNHSLEEQKEILACGVFIGYDQFGIESIPDIPTDDQKIANLIELVKAGFSNQILLAHDSFFERMGVVSKSKPRFPDLVFKKVIPALKKAGVADEAIDQMLRANLVKLFSEKGSNR